MMINRILIKDEEEFNKMLNVIKHSNKIAIDTENGNTEGIKDSALNPSYAKPAGISLSIDGVNGYYIPINHTDYKNIIPKERIKEIFQNKKLIIMHNCVYDASIFKAQYGIDLTKGFIFYDTMIAQHLIDEYNSKGLKQLTERYFGIKQGKFEWQDACLTKAENIYKYACDDAIYTYKHYERTKEEIKKQDMVNLMMKIEMPFQNALIHMKLNGIYFDYEGCKKLEKELKEDKEKLVKKIIEVTPELPTIKNLFGGLNLNIKLDSNKDLTSLLFDKLNLIPRKLTPTEAPAVDKEALKLLKDDFGDWQHPIVPLLLKYSEIQKLLSAYTHSLYEKVINGRLYTDFLDHGTTSGRLSSRSPNFQQLPKANSVKKLKVEYENYKDEDLKKFFLDNFVKSYDIRKFFKSSPGYVMYVSDFGQEELRLAGVITKSNTFKQAFKNQQDLHLKVANDIWKLKIPEEALVETHPKYEEYKNNNYKERFNAKCITGDSLILTDNGYIRFDTLFKEKDKEGDFKCNYNIINDEGKLKNIKKHICRYEDTYLVKTKSGMELKCTLEHKNPIVENDKIVIKELKNLRKGDNMIFKLGSNMFSDNYVKFPRIKNMRYNTSCKKLNLPKYINEEVGYFLGIFTSDGSFSKSNYGGSIDIGLTNKKLSIINKLKDLKSIPLRFKKYNYKNITKFSIENKEVWKIFKEDFKYGYKAEGKIIPLQIFNSPKSVQVEFIKGLFGGDGTIKQNKIFYHSKSHKLVKQIQILLQNFGIYSFISVEKVKAYPDNDYYSLTISGLYCKLFLDIFGELPGRNNNFKFGKNTRGNLTLEGFEKTHKSLYKLIHKSNSRDYLKMLERNNCKLTNKRINNHIKPFISLFKDNNINKDFLYCIDNNVFTDKVISIEKLNKEYVYDIIEPDKKYFLANGLITYDSINFGLLYGRTAHGLAPQLQCSVEEAQKIVNEYFETFPEVKNAMAMTRREILLKGEIKNLYGRKRRFFKIEKNGRKFYPPSALRQAFNTKIQGSCSDILRQVMVKLLEYIEKQPKDEIRMLMTIHDEIVFEIKEDSNVDEHIKNIDNIMCNTVKLDIPLVTEGHKGYTYAEAK